MASTKDWFETVAEAQERAKKRVPEPVYRALLAGSQAGVTLADNTAAFAELGFRPHIADLPPVRSQATTVLGQEISLPVIISPTGVQAVDPHGEVGVARAAAASGTAMGLSSFASKPIEDVIAANEKVFFQIYWLGDKDAMLARLDRAKRAGAKGLIVTLDWVFATARDWGSPPLPERIDVRTAIRFAPRVLTRPGWLWRFLRAGALPDLTTPNLVGAGETGPTFFGAYGEWMGTPPPTWADLAWLREQWSGPLLIKGITHPDDARRAVDIGATAISVSNHGGNNLDSTPAAIRLLPGIAEAVGDQLEVLLDGGVRRGSDVVKAVALGARAVMIGRPYLWGMAAGGERGVHNVLEILRQGIDSTLYGLGRADIHDVRAEDVLVPDGFRRGL
ncbi:mycofactocin biosynthesis FMN-dependent deaminase MftD [Nocardia farcinica]|uniref:L-lactate dehydrogenase [cytochrome] n=5 Tax=Nocardia TaxID=1817 RepID=A0A0H5NMQ6_NOCFR|nr:MULTISPECIES: pre-mycofactocin synthase MftD [Nocardia]AXK85211.1 mycofactocin system-associated heme/flavin dehydrogenase [Nocardia farcinica]MBA4858257.1 mycofactocin biosynthesis FMN-dependent deaminase MftD [Nocardia farcinica]MBC9818026.1 mycofactocin biosynthesis FMN-dependent deaminase MftD [Nocardia farcinica]MBF6067907.1 mycofactocin biosynthesis FMN-dependent deaminase MftD [Nocardia farcinica]MBF6140220.1 mycofactocin biosynthesis FMN-dependent deaminase MftD [Nocardia farcinica]